ncbi:hypothetical protein ABAC402_08225 [Asticcacaulis sp. AC402]|nr:hypothetical protein ABAC402_08225 [Asticcacaulis sp. AC402]
MWGAPALAADGTLTYNGKTIAVREIAGGAIYAEAGNNGPSLEQIQVEIDAKGLSELLPLVDVMIKGGKDMPNLTLTTEGQTHTLFGVRLSNLVLPACTAQSISDPRIQLALHVEKIKSTLELKSATPVNLRPVAAMPLTSCTITITGAQVTADTVVQPIFIGRHIDDGAVGELRDYDQPADSPAGSAVTLGGKSLNAWARKDLTLGTDGKATVIIAYATASGPAFVLTYAEARPDSASLVGGETSMTSNSMTLTKP